MRRRASGSAAAPTAAKPAGVKPPSRLASHAVRRERTRRSVRWPSSVSVKPVQRRSALLFVRATRPSRSSREMRFDIAAVETFSLVCELADGDAGAVLDRDEQSDLLRRDAGDLLAAQLVAEAQQRRAKEVCDRHRIELLFRCLSHSITRLAKTVTRLRIAYI